MGTHTPDTVEFVNELKLDSNRRDFTINTIYYNILTEQIVNPHGGIKDLENKILKTTLSPNKTLSDDGLRVLRAVRFVSTYNLKIEKKTLKALKTFTPLLNKISKERILKELQHITIADYKYNIQNTNFLKLCNKLNLLRYIFNSTISKSKSFTKKDMLSYYNLSQNARLIGFYILVLKNYFITYLNGNQLGYSINQLLGVDGLKESNNNILLTEKIYRVYENLTFEKDTLNASINYLTFSDTEREIINNFLSKKAKCILFDNISFIKNKNIPLSIHELKVSAKDLIDSGIEKIYVSKILSTLYNQVLNMTVANVYEDLISTAKEIHNTFKKIKE
jgi:tRNA nucleotidyltransferase/poly(A) polymerase